MASGFPWGGFGCQTSIDPDQLPHACEELIAFKIHVYSVTKEMGTDEDTEKIKRKT